MLDAFLSWASGAYSPTALWASVFSVFSAYFFFLIAERILPAEKEQKLSLMGFNLVVTLLFIVGNPLASYVGGSVSTYVIRSLGSPLIPLDLISWSNSVSPVLRLILLLPLVFVPILIYDFFFYWYHRAQHNWQWFWQVHKLHHTDEALNVTTTFRNHWTEEIFRSIAIVAPMGLLFNITPAEGGCLSVLLGQWGNFIHANLRIPLGWLGLVICGPQYHRIHHSIESSHWNKNFAAFFPIWDIVFGTAHIPNQGEWTKTGVLGENSTPPLIEVVFGPFISWAKSIVLSLKAKGTS
jgi:sterol desaturase/sphingolipid hydroxylase (fatty acid hydroxylase superfamily)